MAEVTAARVRSVVPPNGCAVSASDATFESGFAASAERKLRAAMPLASSHLPTATTAVRCQRPGAREQQDRSDEPPRFAHRSPPLQARDATRPPSEAGVHLPASP